MPFLILQRYLASDYSSFKIRSTKTEILHRTPYGGNKSKTQTLNDRNKHRRKSGTVVFDFGFWSFVFVSSFDIRISNLNAYSRNGYVITYQTMYRSSTKDLICLTLPLGMGLLVYLPNFPRISIEMYNFFIIVTFPLRREGGLLFCEE